MNKPSTKQRLQYWFDNYMSRGTGALISALFLITIIIIFVVAFLVKVTGSAPENESLPQLAWMGLMRTLDAGTMGGDTGNIFFLLMMLSVTFGGVFIVSALIGILNNGLEDKLDELRKGRSMVLENDHTLILGWNSQVFNIISELVIANQSRKKGAVIVILANNDKVEMEDAIQERISETYNTRIICRTGNPIDLTDIEIASPQTARSIIILAEGDDADMHVIKSVLAITNHPNRRPEPYHIVTQIRDVKNMNVVKMLGTRDMVQPILISDMIARVVAQTSRQSGLSIVYTELLDYGGDEIYFFQEPTMVGKTYGEALLSFEDSSVIGICKEDGSVYVGPAIETLIQAGDQLCVIAEDDDKIKLSQQDYASIIDESQMKVSGDSGTAKAEKALLLGWNHSGAIIIRELDNYVAEGSLVTIVADIPDLETVLESEVGSLKNQRIEIREGDIRDRELLESLHASEYDHVIVLAYNHLPQQEADAITLVSLLHLRDIAEHDQTPFSIISEMLDLRNRALAEAAKVDDFIVSEHLVSLMMTQLSENPKLMNLFTDIFDSEGSEIYLKPVSNYVRTGEEVRYATLVEAASRRGETAIGYRILAENREAGKAYGVHINPLKSKPVTFTDKDRIIVVAQN